MYEKGSEEDKTFYKPWMESISKKDGHRHINTFEQYEDILMYCKNRMLFNISMTAFLVL